LKELEFEFEFVKGIVKEYEKETALDDFLVIYLMILFQQKLSKTKIYTYKNNKTT
jgi:hypothetical protein